MTYLDELLLNDDENQNVKVDYIPLSADDDTNGPELQDGDVLGVLPLRNMVLFPEKIDGKYAMLSRPSDNGHTPFGDIFISYSPDLKFWGGHRLVMKTDMPWESTKIGAGPIPIETSEGWLLFYHGVSGTCNGYVYSIGGAILDLNDPSKVLYRCETFLLTPEEWYEERGFVPNVCFPCATIHDPETGRIAIYYGAADSYVGLAFTEVDDIVDYIKNKPDLSIYAQSANLAAVATTGDYDDLSNKPTIPAAQVNSDWNASEDKDGYVKNRTHYLTYSNIVT